MLRDCLLSVLGQSAPEQTPGKVQSERPENWRQDIRLLVVEDNVINTMVLQGVLAKLGFSKIDKARDGLEAVESAGKGQYDLILMDCQMPRMDGYNATRRLRELGVDTPIVAMTAHALSGDREKCLAAGMNDYLTKPVVIDTLTACLEKWLGGATSSAALPEEPERGEEVLREGDAEEEFLYHDFLKLMLDDEELADTLVKMFVANTPESLERLREAISSGDGGRIKSAAHFIKGAAANLCAGGVRDAAYEIEMAGVHGDIDLASRLLPQLEARWQAFLRHPKVRQR